ncbi:hypothetical protein CAPTEDRAFT_202677 [Capitella teleta]|uniref:Uncharacterized protein n=1 Tax=Capitella teleta TaxID=283909 RepID=R7TIP6_CAPTE|nr:hypothetical protein CAPTEDRAFT_202677 [Capitella teleta]|eukprot:ELT93332.1 hypothetical protein CAPTEDRAFT_202677 [Capitella teleta]
MSKYPHKSKLDIVHAHAYEHLHREPLSQSSRTRVTRGQLSCAWTLLGLSFAVEDQCVSVKMRKHHAPWKGVQLRVHRLDNGSFIATILRGEHSNNASLLDDLGVSVNGSWTNSQQAEYDDTGALYYVVAVVFIYGFSIILMIGSLIRRKSNSDRGMNVYMQGLEKARRVERRREKFKVRLCMQTRRMQKVLGGETGSFSRNTSARGKTQEENSFRDRLSCEQSRWPGGSGANPEEIEPMIALSDTMQVDNSLSPSVSSANTNGASPKQEETCIDMPVAVSISDYDTGNTAETSLGPREAEELTKAQLATLLEEDEDATLL